MESRSVHVHKIQYIYIGLNYENIKTSERDGEREGEKSVNHGEGSRERRGKKCGNV